MKLSKHLMAYSISIELIQEMMTVGWEAGIDRVVRCVDGLPAGARFEFVQPERYPKSITLVFSHPTWPEVESLGAIPHRLAALRSIRIHEPREADE